MKFNLMKGDNMVLLKKLADNSVDSVITDGPYGLKFMNKHWDYDVPSVEFWKEVYRVLKPGGHILSFGGTRTYHRMAVNIEDAGFEIRDQIMWLYATGFPKSYNIGKGVDKLQGNERQVISTDICGTRENQLGEWGMKSGEYEITKGTSPWEGWGSAIKPANEPICLARKPLSEKTLVDNVLKWGTGGINIDECKIGNDKITTNGYGDKGFVAKDGYEPTTHEGRFPANVILDEEAASILDDQSGITKSVGAVRKKDTETDPTSFDMKKKTGNNSNPYAGQSGGASRFFFVPKVSKKERNMGLDGFEDKKVVFRATKGGSSNEASKGMERFESMKKNNHTTVKPVQLMSYLCRLITPPNGVILDPYMGSGSTGIAACLEGYEFIGMEMEEDYFKIAEARIENYELYREFLEKKKKKKT